MGTFRSNPPDVSGVPIREVTPSTLMGNWHNTFTLPAEEFLILPGRDTPAEADGFNCWPLWTRSVVSWSISYTESAGACLKIEISNIEFAGVLTFEEWRYFGIWRGSGEVNGMSGLELPSGNFARFTILPGTFAVSSVCAGSLTLRGV